MRRKLMMGAALPAMLGLSSFAPGFTNLPFKIVVRKAAHQLQVYDQGQLVANYRVVFGSDDLRDKMYEGDRRTPEGKFTIVSKRLNHKWNKMLMLDYPTAIDYQVFNERKAQGLIPASAHIGGGIAIHGTWPKEDFMIDKGKNWTLGCVSMKNDDLNELSDNIQVGTEVVILK